ncbi:MAG: glycosyltransferase family 4 protein [Desulfobacteraceae bacterium]|nr:glycosyltransferase family 4 protein [Desulfobacteraceae bacterium]
MDSNLLESVGLQSDFLLTCGSLLPYRRVEDVVAAFIPLASDHLKLVIAGSGTDEKYRQLIKEAYCKIGCPANIVFMPGHVPQKTMQALYRNCRACIIATEIEACPNIAIEAMASGCVIISSDSSPLPEMFANCSLEYPARNIDALKFQLQQGVYDEALRHRLKSQALERAQSFSWKKMCKRKLFGFNSLDITRGVKNGLHKSETWHSESKSLALYKALWSAAYFGENQRTVSC